MEAGVFYKKTIWSIFISCLIIYSFTRGFHLSDSVKLKTKEEYFTKLDLFHHQSFKRTALSEEKISSRDIDHGLINLLEVKLKKRGVIDQITRLEDETSSGVKKIPNKKEIDVVKDVKNSDAREFSFIRKSESLNKNTVSKDFISSSRKNSFSDERTGETGEKVKIKSSSDAVTRFDNSKNPAIKSNSKNQRSDVGGRAESNIKVFDPTENYERKGKAVMFSDQGATVEDKNINNDKGDNKATVKLMKSSTMDRTSGSKLKKTPIERVQSFKVSSQHDKSTGIPFIASRKITKEELLKSFREKMTLVSPPDYFEKKNNEDFHDSSRYKNFVALSKFLTYRPEFLEKLDKESQHAVKTTRKEKSGSEDISAKVSESLKPSTKVSSHEVSSLDSNEKTEKTLKPDKPFSDPSSSNDVSKINIISQTDHLADSKRSFSESKLNKAYPVEKEFEGRKFSKSSSSSKVTFENKDFSKSHQDQGSTIGINGKDKNISKSSSTSNMAFNNEDFSKAHLDHDSTVLKKSKDKNISKSSSNSNMNFKNEYVSKSNLNQDSPTNQNLQFFNLISKPKNLKDIKTTRVVFVESEINKSSFHPNIKIQQESNVLPVKDNFKVDPKVIEKSVKKIEDHSLKSSSDIKTESAPVLIPKIKKVKKKLKAVKKSVINSEDSSLHSINDILSITDTPWSPSTHKEKDSTKFTDKPAASGTSSPLKSLNNVLAIPDLPWSPITNWGKENSRFTEQSAESSPVSSFHSISDISIKNSVETSPHSPLHSVRDSSSENQYLGSPLSSLHDINDYSTTSTDTSSLPKTSMTVKSEDFNISQYRVSETTESTGSSSPYSTTESSSDSSSTVYSYYCPHRHNAFTNFKVKMGRKLRSSGNRLLKKLKKHFKATCTSKGRKKRYRKRPYNQKAWN